MGRIAQAVGGLFGKNVQLDGMSAREREEEARRIVDAAFFRVNDPTRTDAEAVNRRAQNRAKADAATFSTQGTEQATQTEASATTGQATETTAQTAQAQDAQGDVSPANVFLALRPNQVKSATDNVGTFDPGDNDIRYRVSKRAAEGFLNAVERRQDLLPDELRRAKYFLKRLQELSEDRAKFVVVATKWMRDGKILLPQDEEIVNRAIDVARKHKVDPAQFKSPADLLVALEPPVPAKNAIDPDTVKAFWRKQVLPGGVTVYSVRNTPEGLQAVIDVVRTHLVKEGGEPWGSPWCLSTFTGDGKATESAKRYWKQYSAQQKKIAFKDGKLVAFHADDERGTPGWWGLMEGIESVSLEEAIEEDGDASLYGDEVTYVQGRGSVTVASENGSTYVRNREETGADGVSRSVEYYPDGTRKSVYEQDADTEKFRYDTFWPNGNLHRRQVIRRMARLPLTDEVYDEHGRLLRKDGPHPEHDTWWMRTIYGEDGRAIERQEIYYDGSIVERHPIGEGDERGGADGNVRYRIGAKPGVDGPVPESVEAFAKAKRVRLEDGSEMVGPTRFRIGPLYTGASEAYDKPDIHYIGTGEGAQVYGWGLYASNRYGVAKSYAEDRRRDSESVRIIPYINGHNFLEMQMDGDYEAIWEDDAFADKVAAIDDKAISAQIGGDFIDNFTGYGDGYYDAAKRWAEVAADEYLAIAEAGNFSEEQKKAIVAYINALANSVEEKENEPEKPAIHKQTWWTHRPEGDESHLLLWNGELTEEQKRWIYTQAKKEGVSLGVFIPNQTGKRVYAALENALGSKRAASEFLYRAGIDGVKYPVNASQGGDGSDGWNYVAFSDEHLRVDKRWVWDGYDYESDTNFSPEDDVLMSPATGFARNGGPVNRMGKASVADMAANGPGFVPLEPGENLNRLEKRLKSIKDTPLRNERFGLTSSIATGGNVAKLATVNQKGQESPEAHKFAMKNIAELYAQASVAVRHADKKLVNTQGRSGNYIRLFTPFRFDGQTYVALISQRESEAAPGVHAIEALEVVPTENIKADEDLAFSSGREQHLRIAGSASPIPSTLNEEKITYTLGDVNLTRPEHLDGTPYSADALLEDVQDAVARFELKAAGRLGETRETLGSARQRQIIQEPRLFGGERILPYGAYPMEGRTEPLGGAPGSPAREAGTIALGLSDLTLLYRDLTGGHLPKIISDRSRMGRAYGKYRVGKNKIELAAQIFGLLDESDLDELHYRLSKQGYFRHLDPAWSANAKPATRQLEAERSEARWGREIKRLAQERIRKGYSGERAINVLAHELWHLIDDQDGGLLGRGNLVGHLAALKHYMKEAFPVAGFAGNRELKREAEAFISWWRGVGIAEDTAYFMKKSEETLAEIGAAYFAAPEALRTHAPKLYDAWQFALSQHPKAQEAYDKAVAYVAGGASSQRLAEAMAASWTREAQATARAIRKQSTGMDNSPKRWWMRLNAYLWDRRKPSIMLYNEASKDSLKALRKDVRAGFVDKATYESAKAQLEDGLAMLKKRHLDYTRLGPGLSRLYLADVRGDFITFTVSPGADVSLSSLVCSPEGLLP